MNVFDAKYTPIAGTKGKERLSLTTAGNLKLNIPPGATACLMECLRGTAIFSLNDVVITVAEGLTISLGQKFWLTNLAQLKSFYVRGAAATDVLYVQYFTNNSGG